jgi:L-alanine-DL-glutamate epimerase-like enolase superfamily enzyme
MTDRPKLRLEEVAFLERDVTLRMPFRFGVVTLTEAPQCFVRARIRLSDGRVGWGAAAEMLAPKWFDKSPELSNEDNFDQLRRALAIAAKVYQSDETQRTAFGLHVAGAKAFREAADAAGLPPLVSGFGTALLDRAILDALLRLEGVSVFQAAKQNLFDLSAAVTDDLDGFNFDRFLAGLSPAKRIHARHTVGLIDPITGGDLSPENRVGDGLPETLDDVIETYGVTHFKLKVGGNMDADLARLTQIAQVVDRLPHYRATLDGNEQYADVHGIAVLWRAMAAEPKLARLRDAVLFIEQPISRAKAFSEDVSPLAQMKPVEIDESDATLDSFLEAKALGYTGVSSKSCKGFYKSLLNRARCAKWNAEAGAQRYFMSAEDLTTQAGLAVQQDLALATLIGCDHVERNGHHYVNGMAAAPAVEQGAFLAAHPDLYREHLGAVRLNIKDGAIAIGSLDTAGLASAAMPDFGSLRHCAYEA